MKKLLIIPAVLMLMAGCEKEEHQSQLRYIPKARVENRPTLIIDTILIHGKSHEIIVRNKQYNQGGVGGIMHSPECWCGKEGAE